ncbi:MAG: exopolysaccharide Pel transporter PelG [Planctomycetes bacterium]|nr:exopolysaccharide Pel transporter PelG [Planctomycetota bacterium]
MAGIGFKIQKLLAEDTYWGVVKGYFYSAVISSGPWLISIICIGTLGILYQPLIGHSEHHVFRGWVTYCYASSLVISGALQVLMTRYLSDCIYKNDDESIFSSFVSFSIPTFVLHFLSAVLFLYFCGFPVGFIYGGAFLYAIINEIWIAMIYLSAAKDFITIVVAYFIGAIMSIGGSYFLVEEHGLNGLVVGYTFGQTFLLAILTSRILLEFPIGKLLNFDWLRYIITHPSLLLIGFFYNGAIWVDKIVFWVYQGEEIYPGIYSCSFYETPSFLAFVTIVPTLSIFLVRVETSFYRAYRMYYNKVVAKAGLKEILEEKKMLTESLRLSFYRLMLFQGLITSLSIFMAPEIVKYLNMEAYQLAVLRITILGAFIHALLMVIMIIILYFDWKGLALRVNMLFFFSNMILTWWIMDFDLSYQGYGYFFACLISFCYATLKFFQRFDDLEFITFTSQPLGGLSWDENP